MTNDGRQTQESLICLSLSEVFFGLSPKCSARVFFTPLSNPKESEVKNTSDSKIYGTRHAAPLLDLSRY